MKFLHTSDWHLGISEGVRSLIEDQIYFVDQICGIVEEENVDAVIIAGDIYDRAVVNPEAIKLYDRAMTRLCLELGKQVIVIAGNHDSAERLSSCSDLLGQAGLHVLGAAENEPRVVEFDDTQVFMLPWITEEKIKSIYPEEKDDVNSLTDAYRIACDHMRSIFKEGKRHIVAAHAFITRAETSTSDRAAEIGLATQVGAEVFDGFDYVALGHIHKPQDVTDTVRYSGTPMPYSFGREEKQEKSVTVIDTGDMSRKVIPLDLLHPRTTITGTLEEVLHPEVDERIRTGYVCLKITDDYVGTESIDLLKKIYPYPLEISGKSFNTDMGSGNMTMDEFKEMESDPVEIFKMFCQEKAGIEEPDERLIALFRESMDAYYKEAGE